MGNDVRREHHQCPGSVSMKYHSLLPGAPIQWISINCMEASVASERSGESSETSARPSDNRVRVKCEKRFPTH